MTFDAQSTCARAVAPSPNYGPRRGVAGPDILLLHYTGMPTAQGALDWLCASESGVSCHYFVFEDGRAVQLVKEEERAWHAGVSMWEGCDDVNSRSIGIEIANPGHEFGYPAFPAEQIDAVIALCRDICMRHAILPQHILGHSDVAPGRKQDPGEKFPWAQLAQSGVGHWVDPEPIGGETGLTVGAHGSRVADMKAGFSRYGYAIARDDCYDDATSAVVEAFQRHFRPERVDGVADRSTFLTLERLLAALP